MKHFLNSFVGKLNSVISHIRMMYDAVSNWFNSFDKDDYLRYSFGAAIAAISFLVPAMFLSIVVAHGVFWVSLFVSILVAASYVVWNRYSSEGMNLKRMYASLVGGATVWLAVFVSHFI